MRRERRPAIVVAVCLAVVLIFVLFPKSHSSSSLTPLSGSHKSHISDRVFLLLKTGIEVAYTRLPAHAETTLKRYPTHFVYGDANKTISNVEMIDCLAFMDQATLDSSHLLAYRLRRQGEEQHWNWGNRDIHVDGEGTGWKLDRFKNIPAFAHAWSHDNTKDWYVMIDADSYVFAYSLESITAAYNPDEKVYLGKAVNGNNPFAHGGSGIVLSRGAMRAIFGDSEESMERRIEVASHNAQGSCCGDLVLAGSFADGSGLNAGTYLDRTELGQFQGGQVPTVMIPTNDQWCKPAPTFHELAPWEVYMLAKWEAENELVGRNLTYAQYYHDFIKRQVVPEIRDWVFHPGNYDGADVRIEVGQFMKTTAQANSKEECIQSCVSEPDCMMWTFLSGAECRNFHNVISLGSKMNEHSPRWGKWPEVASGYMVDRIVDFRHSQFCEGPLQDEQLEGWLTKKLRESDRLEADGLNVPQIKVAPS